MTTNMESEQVWFDWLALLGLSGLLALLFVLGLISKRFGEATRAKPYYLGFFAAQGMLGLSLAARAANLILNLVRPEDLTHDFVWVGLYTGLPALAITVSVVVAWRYWSWLLAERD
jgi:hypothetical protein